MKVSGWYIDGFGVFADDHCEELGDGLNLIYGPNEAGKSTLFSFVQGMLFGFPKGREAKKENTYPPLGEQRHGGRLFIESQSDSYTLERFIGRRHKVSLTRSDGAELGEEFLHTIRGGADKKLYQSVFALTLDNLRSLDFLDQTAIKEQLFSAPIFGADSSAATAKKALEGEMSKLLRPRSSAEINDLLQELQEKERALARAKELSAQYGSLVEAEEAALVRKQQLGEREHSLASARGRISALRDQEEEQKKKQLLTQTQTAKQRLILVVALVILLVIVFAFSALGNLRLFLGMFVLIASVAWWYSAYRQLQLADSEPVELDARQDELTRVDAELRETSEGKEKLIRELHQLELKRVDLERRSDVASLELEFESLKHRLGDAISRWRTACLSHALIDETLKEFTRTRQPPILEWASQAFFQVTENYQRIVRDRDGLELVVISPTGEKKFPEQLSRGTLEQLYLCLRLALSVEFGKRNVKLPLLMDDILVNFDPKRAKALVDLLRSVAENHQVLMFSCHPWTKQVFEESGAELKVIELAEAKNLEERK